MHLKESFFEVRTFIVNVQNSNKSDSSILQAKRIVYAHYGEVAWGTFNEMKNGPFVATFILNGVAHGINFTELPSKSAATVGFMPPDYGPDRQYLVYIAADIATKRILGT